MRHNCDMPTTAKTDGPERIMVEIGTTNARWAQFGEELRPVGISKKNMLSKLVEFYMKADEQTRNSIEAQRIPAVSAESEGPPVKPAGRGKRPARGSSRASNVSFPSWMSRVRIPSPALRQRQYSGPLARFVPDFVPDQGPKLGLCRA